MIFMSGSHYWCRTEQLLAQGASPERLGTNGHELLFSQAMDTSQNPHLSGVSNNLVSSGYNLKITLKTDINWLCINLN